MKESDINLIYTYNYKEGKGIVNSIEYFQIINTEKKPINITKDRLEEYIDDLFSKKKDKRNIKQRKPKKEAKEKKNLIIFFTVILTIILTIIFIFLF